ncbi:hypothetical protein DFH29DRAFT_884274 [Suillus ampliporus]|nr:hypothetical protein DFH29DRAFT_884274 [Suillus ampliporus]
MPVESPRTPNILYRSPRRRSEPYPEGEDEEPEGYERTETRDRLEDREWNHLAVIIHPTMSKDARGDIEEDCREFLVNDVDHYILYDDKDESYRLKQKRKFEVDSWFITAYGRLTAQMDEWNDAPCTWDEIEVEMPVQRTIYEKKEELAEVKAGKSKEEPIEEITTAGVEEYVIKVTPSSCPIPRVFLPRRKPSEKTQTSPSNDAKAQEPVKPSVEKKAIPIRTPRAFKPRTQKKKTPGTVFGFKSKTPCRNGPKCRYGSLCAFAHPERSSPSYRSKDKDGVSPPKPKAVPIVKTATVEKDVDRRSEETPSVKVEMRRRERRRKTAPETKVDSKKEIEEMTLEDLEALLKKLIAEKTKQPAKESTSRGSPSPRPKSETPKPIIERKLYAIECKTQAKGIQATLIERKEDGKRQSIAMITKPMTNDEVAYPAEDKELLSMYRALHEWKHIVEKLTKPGKNRRVAHIDKTSS